MKVPRSPYALTDGIFYFARMLDKIRLLRAGELREDLRENVGWAFDQRCCDFLEVRHEDLSEVVNNGESDSDALEWCFSQGRRPSAEDVEVWNGFMRKIGWNDEVAVRLADRKAQSGFADRAEIRTMFDYLDADEGRQVPLQS
jgi:gluconokinase